MRILPKKIGVTTTVAVATTALAAGVLAPAAFADSNPTTPSNTPTSTSSVLTAIKTKAAAAISLRESALQAAQSAVSSGSNHYLSSADRSTVLATLGHDLSGLTALAPVIQADTTVSKAKADYDSIFTSYRVFALALPQTRLAAAADDLTGTVLPRLTDAQSRLEGLLSGADQAKNTAAVQSAMADLGHQISSITAGTDGLAATVLAYTPADWNANHAILASTRADLVTDRADARQARADIKTVVEALK